MKLSGTVLNSKNYEPIALAKIRLKIQDKEIGTLFFTDEYGCYEFKSDQDYIGQDITYVIEKDGFEEKTFSTVIDKAETSKKFVLRQTVVLDDKFATLKGFVYGIIIVSVVFAIVIASFIGSTPIPEYDQNITVGLNDMISINMTINQKWDWMPFANPSWELKSDEQWIQFNKSDGKQSDGGKSDTVKITLLTPDFQFSPGDKIVSFDLINTKLDFIGIGELKLFAYALPLNLTINEEKKRPKLDLRVAPTFEDPHKFGIEINNIGDGAPWWSLRSDKNWIELWDGNERYDSNKRRFDNATLYFKVNVSNIEIWGNRAASDYNERTFDDNGVYSKMSVPTSTIEPIKCAKGRITLGSNNDGKDIIHIHVCEKDSSIEISSTIESWYLPDYYDTNIKPIPDLNIDPEIDLEWISSISIIEDIGTSKYSNMSIDPAIGLRI